MDLATNSRTSMYFILFLEDDLKAISSITALSDCTPLICKASFSDMYGMFAGADHSEHCLVELDSRVNVKRLPPPPLKGLVKGE